MSTTERMLVGCNQIGHTYGWHELTEWCTCVQIVGRVYTPHSGRDGYSIASADGKRVYLVTPETGAGRFSPVRGWRVWKSDALNDLARFPGTDTGRHRAIAKAIELAKGWSY